MATIKGILSKNQLVAMEGFSIKELEKILAQVKELNKKFETLNDNETQAGLDIVVKTQHLCGKLEGIHLVMEELERLAKIS